MTTNRDRRGRYDRAASPRDRERAARRRIVLGAVDVLADDADPALSLAAVAARAGVSRTTLYQHYGGASHLTRVAERMAAGQVHRALRVAASTAVTPVDRLRVLARTWLELAERDDPCARLAIRLASCARPTHVRGALVNALTDALAAASATGLIARSPRPALVAALAAAWAQAAATRTRGSVEARLPPEALAELTWRLAR